MRGFVVASMLSSKHGKKVLVMVEHMRERMLLQVRSKPFGTSWALDWVYGWRNTEQKLYDNCKRHQRGG